MAFIYDLADTWNAGGTTFTAVKMNVTDTASAAGSLLIDLQVGGATKFKVSKTGVMTAGDGTANSRLILDGANGTNQGAFISGNAVGVAAWATGSYSGIVGGAYDPDFTIYNAVNSGKAYIYDAGNKRQIVTTTASETLANKTVDLTSTQAADSLGTRGVPQNSQSAAYTLVAADAGIHILHPSADTTARTFTIPANGTVAFPVGTVVTFINQNGAGVITIAITSDTMRLAGAGTTGSRTLAANGIATAVKLTSTEWLISGTGLT
jgi:hypothetical protein